MQVFYNSLVARAAVAGPSRRAVTVLCQADRSVSGCNRYRQPPYCSLNCHQPDLLGWGAPTIDSLPAPRRSTRAPNLGTINSLTAPHYSTHGFPGAYGCVWSPGVQVVSCRRTVAPANCARVNRTGGGDLHYWPWCPGTRTAPYDNLCRHFWGSYHSIEVIVRWTSRRPEQAGGEAKEHTSPVDGGRGRALEKKGK